MDGWEKGVQAHNFYRCLAGVEPLVWDDFIADVAQKWANKGIFQHSPYEEHRYSDGGEMGENLASSHGSLASMTAFWYEEIAYTNPYGQATSAMEGNEVLGHYTGLIWRSVRRIGCGYNPRGGHQLPLTVCQYYPGGNVGGMFLEQVIPPWKKLEACPYESTGMTPEELLPPIAPQLKNEACPWWRHHPRQVDAAKCKDGTYTWSCVSGGHGRRDQCPQYHPHMCANDNDCDGGRDHCCEKDCSAKGGNRPCPTQPTQTCPWQVPHVARENEPLCADGILSLSCSAGGHGQVAQCSKQKPVMCANAGGCGSDNSDRCCESDSSACSSKGGVRYCSPTPAPVPTPAPPPTPAPTPAAEACPWATPHNNGGDKALCGDGTTYSSSCVAGGHGQRIKCPASLPNMCKNLACGGGQDHCCEPNCDTPQFGGLRPCPPTPGPSPAPTPAPKANGSFGVIAGRASQGAFISWCSLALWFVVPSLQICMAG